MRRVRLLPLIFGSVAILGVGVLAYTVVDKIRDGQQPASGSTSQRPVDVFRLDGISYTAQDGEHVRVHLKADRIEVAKRKFGMVYLNPLKEATLANLQLEVHQRDGDQDVHDILSAEMLAQLLPAETIQQLGVITRIRINGLSVTVLRNGQMVSSISARRATIDPKTRIAELAGDVQVAAADGRSIRSQESTWDQAAGLFSISGPYLLMKSGKVEQGTGARFDAELHGVQS